jgi:hypothetical protein
MNTNLMKDFHFQVVLRHSQLNISQIVSPGHEPFFKIHKLQSNHSIRLMVLHLMLKYV